MVVYIGHVPTDLRDLNVQDFEAHGAHFFEVYETIDSTNNRMRACLECLLEDQYKTAFQGFVIADEQTAGRGRLQRFWWSPRGQNIYISFGFVMPIAQTLYGLSLVVGLALRDTIQKMTGLYNIAIKWPNDVYVSGVKVAGILIETFQANGYWHIVIGVGVNVNQVEADVTMPIGQPWTSIALVTERKQQRAEWIMQLSQDIWQYCANFQTIGWVGFQDCWKDADWLYGRFITVSGQPTISGESFSGESLGVDQHGCLQVKDAQGRIHVVLSGEVSVRVPEGDVLSPNIS